MNEQNNKLQRVKKSCRTAKNVSRVVTILMVVACILCLVGGAIVYSQRAEVNQAIAQNLGGMRFDNIDIGGMVQLDVDMAQYLDKGEYATVVMIYCLVGAVVTAITAAIFGMINRIFSNILNSETPFTPEVIRSMKKIFIAIFAVLLIFYGIGTGLLSGLLMWCVYCIMDYGVALQTEVDDTI